MTARRVLDLRPIEFPPLVVDHRHRQRVLVRIDPSDRHANLLSPRTCLDGSGGAHTCSAGTVLNLHLVLTQAFGQAVRWGLLDRSPVAGAQPPRPRRPEPAVIDAALASRILEAARGHLLELPIAIALATGMRREPTSMKKST